MDGNLRQGKGQRAKGKGEVRGQREGKGKRRWTEDAQTDEGIARDSQPLTYLFPVPLLPSPLPFALCPLPFARLPSKIRSVGSYG